MRGKHYIARSATCFFKKLSSTRKVRATLARERSSTQQVRTRASCFVLPAGGAAQRSAGQQPARGFYKTSGGLYFSALLSLGCSYLARLSLSAFSDFLFFSSSPFVFFSFIRLKANRYDFFSRNHSIESINSSLLLQLVARPLVRSFSPSSLQSLSLPLSL